MALVAIMLVEVEETRLIKVTMEQPVGVGVDISLAVGEGVEAVDAVVKTVEKEEIPER